MTIDEKVVATTCADHEAGETGYVTFKVAIPWNTQLIPHSDYAALQQQLVEANHRGLDIQYELDDAAKANEFLIEQLAELEKHSERIEVAYLASESRAEDAETQLAELRGKLEGLADKWGSVLKQMGGKGTPLTDNVIAICVRELRAALAAAEGSDG